MNELIEDLKRRAQSCRQLARECAEHSDDAGYARCMGKADAYEHAAALVQAYLNQEQQQIVGPRHDVAQQRALANKREFRPEVHADTGMR